MINILTDSAADLSQEMIQKYKIQVVPLYVLLRDKSFQDGLEITNADLFKYVDETNELPKTSATSVGDFIKAFADPCDHIYIGISDQISATVKNALIAAESLGRKNIYVINTLNLSSGTGMLAIRAAELRDSGCSAEEIVRQIKDLVPKVRTLFIVETLDYLYKGGRCSALQNVVSSLLSIRPVIHARSDGTLGVMSKIRGSRQKALQAMLDEFRSTADQLDHKFVFIAHTGCHEDAAYLKAEVLKIAPIDEVCATITGSVVASHCGPDTISLIYLLK